MAENNNGFRRYELRNPGNRYYRNVLIGANRAGITDLEHCDMARNMEKIRAVFESTVDDGTYLPGWHLRENAPDIYAEIFDSDQREYWQEHNCLL